MINKKVFVKFNDIVTNIYAEDDLQKMQSQFLLDIKELIEYDYAMFDLADTLSAEQVDFFSPVYLGFTDKQMNQYYDKYQYLDYTNWILTENAFKSYRDTDVVNEKYRENSKIFQEWLAPIGIYFGGGIIIEKKGILLGTVTFFRCEEKGDYTDNDLLLWRLFAEHLSTKLGKLFPVGVKNLKEKYDQSSRIGLTYNLTKRESEVLELVISGYSNEKIANVSYISISTVKKHINKVFTKTGTKSRSEVISKFLKKQH